MYLRVCVHPLRMLRGIGEEKEEPPFFYIIPPSRFLYPSRPVPLGKCWRREVAPTDLTIDKGVFFDLLKPEWRKEMSCSSHDKYPNGAACRGNGIGR